MYKFEEIAGLTTLYMHKLIEEILGLKIPQYLFKIKAY